MKASSLIIITALACCLRAFSPADGADTRPADNLRARIISTAKRYLGTRYNYGGTSTKGFDCSGFVRFVYQENGITLPRSTVDQFKQGKKIEMAVILPGDLVFFRIYGDRISHVGIFVSRSTFIHAPSSGKQVSFADMNIEYWKKNFAGAVTYIGTKAAPNSMPNKTGETAIR
ncbi:MAG: hypothetical protein A2176_03380 [Spirochaetes bacterium RBG_13_51_14]|nr:MAG: hypothetical protein A2176_03380 [Spirochaetes bacterium RBG_13_51_14]